MPTITEIRNSLIDSAMPLLTERRIANKNMALYNSMHPQGMNEDITPFKSDDFGSSRFDERARTLQDYSNPVDLRAEEQSTLGKWGNALVKTAVTTGTTIANVFNTAIMGPLYGASASTDFVNNPISNFLQGIEEQFEQWFPNYRSSWEQEAPWYRRMGTANFWADDIVKNVGFSMGSVAAARWATKGLASIVRGMSKKAYREAFEAIGKQFSKNMTGSEIRGVLRQASQNEIEELSKRTALAKLGRLAKTEDILQGVTGSILGTVGEAQWEAQRAYSDFVDKNKAKLDAWFSENDAYMRIMYEAVDGRDEDGNPIDYDTFKQTKYNKAVRDIEREGIKVGNNVFGFESILLTATNFATFRRFFSGGFKAFNPASVAKTASDIEKGQVAKMIGRRLTSEGTLEAYNKLGKFRKGLKIATPMITEGPVEEMGQNWINKSADFYHGSYLNQHFGMILNDEYNAQASNAINAAAIGFAKSYGDIEQWEDGFAGAIFGIAGIPGLKRNKNYKPNPETGEDTREKNEKRKYSGVTIPLFNAEGSIGDRLKEIQDESKLIDETVDYVNSFIKTPEKQRQFESAVISLANSDNMQRALTAQDRLQYMDSKYQELMNVVSQFSNAGMDDVLDGYIDSIANSLTKEKIEEIRPMLSEEEQKKSADEIMAWLRDEVVNTKKLISGFRENRDRIGMLHSAEFTPRQLDLLSEMVSLADYKNERAMDIASNYHELFKNGIGSVENVAEQLIGLLHFDDKAFDDIDKLDNKSKEKAIIQITADAMKEFPAEWNMAKKSAAFHDLFDAYMNIVDAVKLNNEFGELVAQPMTMRAVFAKLFDDHLKESEKVKVKELTDNLKNAESVEEVKNVFDSLNNDEIGNTVKLRADKIDNDFVKEYLKSEKQRRKHESVLNAIAEASEYISESFGVPRQFVDSLRSDLSGMDFNHAAQYLLEKYEDSSNEGEKKLLEHFMSVYADAEITDTKTEEPVTNDEMKERAAKIMEFLNDDSVGGFQEVTRDYFKNNNIKAFIDKKIAGIVTGRSWIKLYNGHNLAFNIIVDLLENKIIARVGVMKDKNSYAAYKDFTLNDNTAYTEDDNISLAEYEDEITQALSAVLPESDQMNIGNFCKTIMNTEYNSLLNRKFVKMLSDQKFEDFIELFDIPEEGSSVPEENRDDSKAKKEAESERLRGEFNKKMEPLWKSVNDAIEKIKETPKGERSEEMDKIMTQCQKMKRKLNDLSKKVNDHFAKAQEDVLDENLDVYRKAIGTLDSLEPVVLPSKQDVTGQSGDKDVEVPWSSSLIDKEKSDRRFITVSEYDRPEKDRRQAPEEAPKRTYQKSPNYTEADEMAYNYLIESGAYKNIFYLKKGDTVHFRKLTREDSAEMHGYYGLEMPYAILDKGERVVGLVRPEQNGTLYSLLNGKPGYEVKVNDKWASESRLYPHVPTAERMSAVNLGETVLCYLDSKYVPQFSQHDKSVMMTRYNITESDFMKLADAIKESAMKNEFSQAYHPGQVLAIVDKGDHFQSGIDRVNFYPDAVSPMKAYEVPSGDIIDALVDEVSSMLENGSSDDDFTNAANIVNDVLAGGGNMESYFSFDKDIDGGHTLNFHHIVITEGNKKKETVINLVKADQSFRENFTELLTTRDGNERIPEGIVVSVSSKTMSEEGVLGGLLNGSNIRDYIKTYMDTYLPYNVNADFDDKTVQTSNKTENGGPVSEQMYEMFAESFNTYTGESKGTVDDFIAEVESRRSELLQNSMIRKYHDFIGEEGVTRENLRGKTEGWFSTLRKGERPAFVNALKTAFPADATVSDPGGSKTVYTYLFADTKDKNEMQRLKDCK